MDASKKQRAVVPQAQQIKVEDQEESVASSHVVPHRGGKGKGTAPAVVEAAYKGKEAVKSAVKRSPAAISAQKTKAMERTAAPHAQQIKVGAEVEVQGESRSVAPRGVLQRGDKGKGTAPAFVKAAYKRKEAVESSVKTHPAAISAQQAKGMDSMERKKKAGLVAAQKGKAAVMVGSKTKPQKPQVSSSDEEEVISNDDDDEVISSDEEDSGSDEDYVEEEESMDEDSNDDSEYEEEEEEEEEEEVLAARQPPPVVADEVADVKLEEHEQQQQVEETEVVEETHEVDNNESPIVRVRKFEGCTMLSEVDRTEDSGIASRTRRRKVLNMPQNSQLEYNKHSKGTFSDPVEVYDRDSNGKFSDPMDVQPGGSSD